MIGCQSSSGCQPPHQRSTTTRPNPNPARSSVIHAARIQPGPSRYRLARLRCGGAGAGVSWWIVAAVTSPLRAGLDQILNKSVELRLREVEGRHHVLRVPLLDVGVRDGDRLVHEGGERLGGCSAVLGRAVRRRGTVSSLWPESGTQNEWMTSFACRCRSTERPTGSRSVPLVTFPSFGYWKLQANCWAVTFTWRTFLPSASSRASTIALTIPIAVTSTVGISV